MGKPVGQALGLGFVPHVRRTVAGNAYQLCGELNAAWRRQAQTFPLDV
jgi:hypothetical protein